MKKWMLPVVLLIAGIILIACSETDAITMGNDFPQGVLDGAVSEEYYLQLQEFHKENEKGTRDINAILDTILNDSLMLYDKNFIEESIEKIKKYNFYLENISFIPQTYEETELEKVVQALSKEYIEINTAYLLYLSLNDERILKKAHEMLLDAEPTIYELQEKLRKYGLEE